MPRDSFPRQNSRHFADDIFNTIVFNELSYIFIQLPMDCIYMHVIGAKSPLVYIMACRQTGPTPLHESIVTQFTVQCHQASNEWINFPLQAWTICCTKTGLHCETAKALKQPRLHHVQGPHTYIGGQKGHSVYNFMRNLRRLRVMSDDHM